MAEKNYIRWLDTLTLDDTPLVGGKNASLDELAGSLSAGIKVPEGFAITAVKPNNEKIAGRCNH